MSYAKSLRKEHAVYIIEYNVLNFLRYVWVLLDTAFG